MRAGERDRRGNRYRRNIHRPDRVRRRRRSFCQAKSLTTPADLIAGHHRLPRKERHRRWRASTRLIHGSTTAINTLIERKGAKTGLIVTRGTRDVYTIGRGNRPGILQPVLPRAPAAGAAPLTLRGRRAAARVRRGATSRSTQIERSATAVQALKARGRRGGRGVLPALLRQSRARARDRRGDQRRRCRRRYISLVARDPARVPRVRAHVDHGGERLHRPEGRRLRGKPRSRASARIGFTGDLSIMQSNGGVMSPERRDAAAGRDDGIGPGRRHHRRGASRPDSSGYDNVISFDMGGTTAKASLVQRRRADDGAQAITSAAMPAAHPVMLPVVDIVEVGAGGGSIAWIDEVGALKVGPQSAGADPGPDLLPRRRHRADGHRRQRRARPPRPRQLPRRRDAARRGRRARGHRARRSPSRSAWPSIAAAEAIVEIAVAKMSLAVREVSVERGYDPRDFALVGFGGAGPLHACAIARELYIPTVIIPLLPVALLRARHAAGGRAPRLRAHLSTPTLRTRLRRRSRTICTEMADEARAVLRQQKRNAAIADRMLDMRYVGQEFTLSVRSTRRRSKRGDAQAIRKRVRRAPRAPLRPLMRPTSRSRSSTSASPPSASARRCVPERRSRAAAKPARHAHGLSSTTPTSRSICPVYDARRACRRARVRRARADRRNTASTTVMFAGDALHGRADRRTHHHRRERADMIATAARSRHARSHPQRAARHRQRNGGRPAAHILQHDDLRGAGLLHRAARRQGRSDLAECRRRVAFRRRPRRHHRGRHEAVRRDGFKPGDVIITNHQAVAASTSTTSSSTCRSSSSGELMMFAMVRAHWIDVGGMSTGFGAGADGRRSLDGRPAARPDQDLRGRQARREDLPGHQGQHPLSRILARRHAIADGRLPARRSGASTSCSPSTARKRCSAAIEQHLRRDRAEVPQGRRADSGRRLRGASVLDDDGARQGRSGARSTSRSTVDGRAT